VGRFDFRSKIRSIKEKLFDMKSVYFVTNSSNKTKVTAIKNVLGRLPASGFYFDTIKCEQKERRPLSIEEILHALGERLRSIESNYKCPTSNSLVHAIDIQKGTNLKNTGKPLQLICAVSVLAQDESRVSIATNTVDLPEEVRTLVLEEKMPLYDAYGKVFGEKIKNKEVSLYEHLTGSPELLWFEETVFKTFVF
jgi:hypothetical protein